MRKSLFFLLALYFALPAVASQRSGNYSEPAMDEFRIEIDDLKHALKSTQVELGLLEELVKKQENVKGNLANKETSTLSALSVQLSSLEKKVFHLEKTLEKAAQDLRTLSQSTNQALSKIQLLEQDFSSQEKRFDEVAKLKGTLTSISKAIGQKPNGESAAASKSYFVKAGDSLEKIARSNRISVDAIRKANNLSGDRIHPGQELRLPDDTP